MAGCLASWEMGLGSKLAQQHLHGVEFSLLGKKGSFHRRIRKAEGMKLCPITTSYPLHNAKA